MSENIPFNLKKYAEQGGKIVGQTFTRTTMVGNEAYVFTVLNFEPKSGDIRIVFSDGSGSGRLRRISDNFFKKCCFIEKKQGANHELTTIFI